MLGPVFMAQKVATCHNVKNESYQSHNLQSLVLAIDKLLFSLFFFFREELAYQEITDTWEETIKQTAERRRLNAERIKKEAQEALERSQKIQLLKLQLKNI